MEWTLVEYGPANPKDIFDLLSKHKLLPESVELSASLCNSVGSDGQRYQVVDGDTLIADIIVSSVMPGEACSVDVVPVAKHFRSGYHDKIREAVQPLLAELFDGYNVRRVSAVVPATRSRTKKLLSSLGFVAEGRQRDALKLYGKEPEDLRMLGMTRREYDKEYGDGEDIRTTDDG